MSRAILLMSFKKIVAILGSLVLIAFMAACGGGGGNGPDDPTKVTITGTVDDGTLNSPIRSAECAFVDLNGDSDEKTTAGWNGNFSIQVDPDKEGYIKCGPPDSSRLKLSTFLSTKGWEAGEEIHGENVTPTTTLVANIINSQNPADREARKNELLNRINNPVDRRDRLLSFLVEVSTVLYKHMFHKKLDVRFGDDLPGDVGYGGGAEGDAGDGAVTSPISNARCHFALDLDGEVLSSAALEDLRDGLVNRPDLAAIKEDVEKEIQDLETRQDIKSKEAFDEELPELVGKAYSDDTDENGKYSLPIPPKVEGFVRCTPLNQPMLKLATFIPKLEEGEKVGGQDVTPATTFFSHSIANNLTDNLKTVKKNYLDDISGLGDIRIIRDGEIITGFELKDTSVKDKDVGLVAFAATSLFNILYKNERDVDYLALLDGLIEKKEVNPEDLKGVGIIEDAEKWAQVVNTSNDTAGKELGTNLKEALLKARIRVKVTEGPGGGGIPGAEVKIPAVPSGIGCECGGEKCACDLPVTTNDEGVVIFTLTGVSEDEAVPIEVEASFDAGFESATITTDVVAFATVDLIIPLTPISQPKHTLQVTISGNGSGTVISSPSGINCGSDCKEDYIEDEVVTLTATANTGSNFTGWSGDPDCSDGQVTMDSAITCTAGFALLPPPPPQYLYWDIGNWDEKKWQ